ncbi:MAG: heavy-metal-associated domain-containing protein [Desulfohalobiaceae bacterium]|nr:heavy-metal-associated domain-containing protein [Desulfohalobiaceae bacterium]
MCSRKLFPIAGVAVFLLFIGAWAAQAQNLRVAVMNVRTCTCDASADEVNIILGEMPGVMDVEVDIQRHMVTVTFDENRVSLQDMKEKLARNDHRVHGKVRFLQ